MTAAPFVTLKNPATGNAIRNRGRPVRNHGGNVSAGSVSSGARFDLARLVEWPGTDNGPENLTLYRDWNATLNGPQHRYSFARAQLDWHMPLAGYRPAWQPAFNRVNRVWRKGASGGLQRILVVTMEVNTNAIRPGDQCWFYHLWGTGTYEGSVSTAASIDVYPGFPLRLRGTGALYTITACRPSPEGSPFEGAISEIEITFTTDLPPVDFAPERWNPYPVTLPGHSESKLVFVHHSFYADATTKRLRAPIGGWADTIRNQVLRYGGSAVIGGSVNRPDWQCWTTLANQMNNHALVFALYQMEQVGLAETFGDLPTERLCSELEHAPHAPWTDDAARADTSLPNPLNAIGLRTSLFSHMMPIARSAWGANRSLVVKGTGGGGLEGLRSFDLAMQTAWPGTRVILGNRDLGGSWAPSIAPGERQIDYGVRADADAHASELQAKATAMGFDGAIMTGFSAPADLAPVPRGRQIGLTHTAMAAKGFPVCYRDFAGEPGSDPWGFAGLYTDVPGSTGTTVQAVQPGLRAYCGRAGRTTV